MTPCPTCGQPTRTIHPDGWLPVLINPQPTTRTAALNNIINQRGAYIHHRNTYRRITQISISHNPTNATYYLHHNCQQAPPPPAPPTTRRRPRGDAPPW